MRRRRQNIGLKLLQSVRYNVKRGQHGVIINESVKQRKAAITLRSPASSSRPAPSPRAAPARALSLRIESKLRSALIDLNCGPWRDLKVFAELSRTALPSEGSARLAIMAHVGGGCEGCKPASSSSIRFFTVV